MHSLSVVFISIFKLTSLKILLHPALYYSDMFIGQSPHSVEIKLLECLNELGNVSSGL